MLLLLQWQLLLWLLSASKSLCSLFRLFLLCWSCLCPCACVPVRTRLGAYLCAHKYMCVCARASVTNLCSRTFPPHATSNGTKSSWMEFCPRVQWQTLWVTMTARSFLPLCAAAGASGHQAPPPAGCPARTCPGRTSWGGAGGHAGQPAAWRAARCCSCCT